MKKKEWKTPTVKTKKKSKKKAAITPPEGLMTVVKYADEVVTAYKHVSNADGSVTVHIPGRGEAEYVRLRDENQALQRRVDSLRDWVAKTTKLGVIEYDTAAELLKV